MITAGIIIIGIGLYVLTLSNQYLSLTLALIPAAFFIVSGLIVIAYGIKKRIDKKNGKDKNG